jgi:hypothetical protein
MQQRTHLPGDQQVGGPAGMEPQDFFRESIIMTIRLHQQTRLVERFPFRVLFGTPSASLRIVP